MSVPTEAELASAIAEATVQAVVDLFRAHPDEHFYYCSLITSGEAHSPRLVAWSHEALQSAAGGDHQIASSLKWSYAESPYYCWGEGHFAEVDRLFNQRPALDYTGPAEAWDAEVELRLRAMEHGMRLVDQAGHFGTDERRTRVVVNVEVMPPDPTNTARARRLNPAEALHDWLSEAAEQ